MDLEVVKIGTEEDINGLVGAVLKGEGEAIETGLGTQFIDKMYWSKIQPCDKGTKFEGINLDNFHQEIGDKGITFLTPKAQ